LSNEYFIFAPHSQSSSPSSHQHYQPGLPGYPGVLHSDHISGLPGYPGILNPDEHSHKRNRTYSEDIVISYAMENDSDSMDENDDSIGIDDSTNHGNGSDHRIDHPAHINSIHHSIDTTDHSTCIDHGIDISNHRVSHMDKDIMNGSICHVDNLINRIDDGSPHLLNSSADHRINSNNSVNDDSSNSVVNGIKSYNLNSLSIASHKHGGTDSHINQDSDTSTDLISNNAIDSTSYIAPIDDSANPVSTKDNDFDSPTLIHGFIDHIDSSSGSNHGTNSHVTNSTNHSVDNSSTHNIHVDNANNSFDSSWASTPLIPNPSLSSTVSSILYDNDVGAGGSMNYVDTNPNRFIHDGIDDDNDASDQIDNDHMDDNLIDVNDHADNEVGVTEGGIQAVLTEEIM
jgi:hypothetical protein